MRMLDHDGSPAPIFACSLPAASLSKGVARDDGTESAWKQFDCLLRTRCSDERGRVSAVRMRKAGNQCMQQRQRTRQTGPPWLQRELRRRREGNERLSASPVVQGGLNEWLVLIDGLDSWRLERRRKLGDRCGEAGQEKQTGRQRGCKEDGMGINETDGLGWTVWKTPPRLR